jgi:hypothetical protein
MGQEVAPPGRHFAGLLAPFPGRTRGIADQRHQLGDGLENAWRQRRPGHAQHGRGQDHRIGIDQMFDRGAQDDMPAHRMRGEHVGAGRCRFPGPPEGRQIVQPDLEIFDMARRRIAAQPARACLAAPVRRRDAPARPVPFFQRFEIFLVMIAATGKEQDRSARRVIVERPVDPPHLVPIGRGPHRLARRVRDRSPIDRVG